MLKCPIDICYQLLTHKYDINRWLGCKLQCLFFLTLWPYSIPCLLGHPYFCEHLHTRWYIFYTLSVFRYTKVYNDFPKWFVDQNKICLFVSRHKFYSHSVLNFVYNLIQIEVVGTSLIVSHTSFKMKKKFPLHKCFRS